MKDYILDARGLDCPKPLLRTKQALEEQEFQGITVLVSNAAARENVMRFLKHSGMTSLEWKEQKKGEFSISGIRSKTGDNMPDHEATSDPDSSYDPAQSTNDDKEKEVILIANNTMGRGKKELGKLLLKGYIYTLGQLDSPPGCLIFMNSGVKLVLEGSESLEDLKSLKSMGVEILVCGTCLDYLDVKSEMRIGQVSNMYDIAQKLHGPGKVLAFS